jgi:hypothetical protein
VDAFGHSMGGLLLRKFAGGAGFPYLRDDNFQSGDLHMLVTVDSPHLGSPLADLIIDLAYSPATAAPVRALAHRRGMCVTCGAVADLRTDSWETTHLPATSVPAHAFVGTGGSDIFPGPGAASLDPWARTLLDIFDVFYFTGPFPLTEQHDLIVGRTSQEGGLGPGRYSLFPLVTWEEPRVLGIHIDSVTKEQPNNARAIDLLNAQVNDTGLFAPGFTANSGAFSSPPPASVARRTRMSPASLTGGIAIIAPLPGATVLPGGTVSVTVEPYGGYAPVRVLLASNHDTRVITTPPFTATLAVPLEAQGEISLTALAYDASDAFAEAEPVAITVDTSGAALMGLTLKPSSLVLLPPVLQHSLTVVGHFSDGADRELTSAVGTAFVSVEPAIATVDGGGTVTGSRPGHTRITATHGGFSATSSVKVADVLLELRWSDSTTLTWTGTASAIGYDLVTGSIGPLRGSGGDFSTAVTGCAANDLAETSFLDAPPQPGAGEIVWFLARAVLPAESRTYDAADFPVPSQVGARDDEINASLLSCP